mgnify:CR=1 FL=1
MNGSSKQANKRIELANRKHDEIDIKKTNRTNKKH